MNELLEKVICTKWRWRAWIALIVILISHPNSFTYWRTSMEKTQTFYNPKRFKLNLIWVERKCENDHKWLGSVLGTLRWNSLNELRIETLCRLSINHVTCWYSRTIRPLHSHFTHLSFNEKTLSPSSHTQYEKNSGRGKVLPWKKSVRQSNEYCDEICSQFTKNQPTAYSQLLN